MQNSVYKTVRKIATALGQSDLAQQQAGRITGEPANEEMAKRIRVAGAESCVLLKNEKSTLPINPNEETALFGRVQIDYFYVGNGSGGDVCAPYAINLASGLENAGVKLNKEVLETYKTWCAEPKNVPDPGFWAHWPRYHEEMPLDSQLVERAAKTSSSAVVVIGRSAGEDRENVLKKGSFFLTDKEKEMLNTVTKYFEKVVLLLNVGSLIDFSEIDAYGSKITAIMLVWQLGMESGNAVADVLTGKVTPSGKLADTVACNYKDYPSAENFGNKKENKYVEDIYVGYRYFETLAPQKVLYPFGYGLSYTSFDISFDSFSNDSKKQPQIEAKVSVTNSGSFSGKEVVQLYAECPCGKLGKPSRVLVAFKKTKLLAPGESQTFTLTADYRSFASYDDGGITGHKSAWVLEKGVYTFWAGNSVRNTKKTEASSFEIKEDTVLEQCAEVMAVKPEDAFNRLTAKHNGLAYTAFYEPAPTVTTDLKQIILSRLPKGVEQTGDKGYKLKDVKDGKVSLDDFVAQLSNEELELISRGEGMMDSALGPKGNAGAFGGISESLRAKGIPPMITTDGPSGIRLLSTCSLLPSGTALASSWDTEMVQDLYTEMGREMVDKGTDILLAPGMNIHRNPLCGRNFEYFSEDPVLTGLMATAVVSGIQSSPVSACPKHFACNNQEFNRNYNNSVVSERALREIYLKGFEICVKKAAPKNIMTSYNKINGVWSHYNYELCTTVLRDEWGYKGSVMTDWWMRYAPSPEFPKVQSNAYRVRAQVDVLMPGAKTAVSKTAENDGTLLESLGAPEGITLGELQRTAKNVLSYIMASGKEF